MHSKKISSSHTIKKSKKQAKSINYIATLNMMRSDSDPRFPVGSF